jgi:hypothetical protein
MQTFSKIVTALALFALTITVSRAQIVDINLDSITVPNSGGVDATSLLASYGITISNISPSDNTLLIDSDVYQTYEGASPGNNYLQLNSPGSPPNTYTLNFSASLTSFTFTRIAQTEDNAVASWTATAYSGNTELSSVGEGFFDGTEGASTYTLTGSDITSVVIAANGEDVAGVSSAPIDNIILDEATPEPSTWALMLGGLSLLIFWRSRRCRGQAKPVF